MPSIGFVVPLLPGKTETDKAAMLSCWRGDRKPEYEASRTRLGITRESVWIQSTPMGDFAVVYVETDDPEATSRGLATSAEAFDKWFREHVRDVHGVNVEDGYPPVEQILDFAGAGRPAGVR